MEIYLDFALKIGVAILCGAIIGIEREFKGQLAGIKTHIFLAVGAALAMIVSRETAMQYGEPTRIAAQVVSGIGFLGAGAIIRLGANVKGLTTATGMWTVAIIGLLCGAGFYWQAIAASVVLAIVLVTFSNLKTHLPFGNHFKTLIIGAAEDNLTIDELIKILKELKVEYEDLSIKVNKIDKTRVINAKVRIANNEQLFDTVKKVTKINGITDCELI